MKKLLLLLVAVGLLSAACSGSNQAENESATVPETDPTTEVGEPSSEGGVAIAFVSPDPNAVPMGDAEIILEVTDSSTNEPVAIEDLQINLSMEMDGMEPMTTMTQIELDDQPGRYRVMTNLGMAGMWTMEVASADPAMPGEATFNIDVK